MNYESILIILYLMLNYLLIHTFLYLAIDLSFLNFIMSEAPKGGLIENSSLSPAAPIEGREPLHMIPCGVHAQAGPDNWISGRTLRPSTEPVVADSYVHRIS